MGNINSLTVIVFGLVISAFVALEGFHQEVPSVIRLLLEVSGLAVMTRLNLKKDSKEEPKSE